MSAPRIVLMASGDGSIAQAIIDAQNEQVLSAEIVGLISDQPAAQVIQRAQSAAIPTTIIPIGPDRSIWNSEIILALSAFKPDLVVCAGFMRVLSAACVAQFKIVNSHPALLPLFSGAHAVRDALAAGATTTGVTIHWVDTGVDTGEIIAQEEVEIITGDSQAILHERIKIVERRLYVVTLQEILSQMVRPQ